MRETIRRLLEGWFNLRPDEYRKVLLAFGFSFGSSASYVVARSAAGSLFLKRVGPERLPLMYILAAVVVALAAVGYSRLATSRRLDRVIRLTVLALGVAALGLRGLLYDYHHSLVVVAGVYLLAEVRGGLGTIQVSTLLNELFSGSDPKRVLGLIGLGATLAGVLFGLLAGSLAPALGTANLLYLVAGVELLTLAFLWYSKPGGLLERPSVSPQRAARAPRHDPIARNPGAGWRAVLHSPYARVIAGLIFVVVLAVTVVQYQWQHAASRAYEGDEDGLTGYFSFYFSAIAALIGLTQLLVTARFLRVAGMLGSLLVLPTALLAASLGILAASPTLVLLGPATLAKGCDLFRRTVHDPSVQILYWPMGSVPRRQAIAFVGGIAKPFAEALAGVLLLEWALIGEVRELSYVVLGLLGVCFYLVYVCRRNYVRTLAASIRDRRVDLTAGALPGDLTTVAYLERALESDDPHLVGNALEILPGVQSRKWGKQVVLHLFNDSPRVRRQACEYLGDSGQRRFARPIAALLTDRDREVRVAAIGAYCRLCGKDSFAAVQPLADDPDPAVAAAALVNLARHGGLGPGHFGEAHLEQMAHHHNRHLRLAALEIMAALKEDWALALLQRLFEDPDFDVALAAIDVAGRMGHPGLVGPLTEQLRRPAVAGFAVAALAGYGEAVLPQLAERLRDRATPPMMRREIVKVLRRIPSQQTLNLLLDALDDDDEVLAEEILTLKRLIRHPGVSPGLAGRKRIEDCFRRSVECYYRDLAAVNDMEHRPVEPLLLEALRERAARDVLTVLNVLAILYPDRDLDSVAVCLHRATPRTRAMAVELLSHILDHPLKPAVLAMVDNLPLPVKLHEGRAFFRLPEADLESRLRHLTRDANDWVRAVAIRQVGRMRLVGLLGEVRAGLESPSYVVRETAFLALKELLPDPELQEIRDRLRGAGFLVE